MKTRDEIFKCVKNNRERFQEKFPLKSLAVFDSYANGQTERSDIDLVEFSKPVGFQFIDLIEGFEMLLEHKIDLASKADDAIYV